MFYLTINQYIESSNTNLTNYYDFETESLFLEEYNATTCMGALKSIRKACNNYFIKASFNKYNDYDYCYLIQATAKQKKERVSAQKSRG
ncbi:hypothetical protein OO007_10195 [Cocleimonas sp. KMM 6892]|uniref:hypothetical protein n=1 Tax=unclassified Cocleimonas TaxID=2639732 RepID=UPI002DB82CB3|nr:MULTISPECIES: hypothetical protein [unclassified Cocleimonas]MEB8432595.1 hypothetical protein [Cocleimonas sp. KMM 6892]MEC4715454.1 hypothetical protein [Cocleimonas sp. KMM 6895]